MARGDALAERAAAEQAARDAAYEPRDWQNPLYLPECSRLTTSPDIRLRNTIRESVKATAELEQFNDSELWQDTDRLIQNYQPNPDAKIAYRNEYLDNAYTALWEALAHSGYLSRVDYAEHDLETTNQLVLQRLLNGYHAPNLPAAERARRRAEIHEELTIQNVAAQIANGELPPDTEVLTESVFPDDMDPTTAERTGYRPKNKKGMLRATGFRRDGNGQLYRVVEQISFTDLGSLSWRGLSTRANLEQPQIYARRDVPGGVTDIARALDAARPGAKYGETGATLTPLPDYNDLRAVSANLDRKVAMYAAQLADFEKNLATQKLSQTERDRRYAEEVKATLMRIGAESRDDPALFNFVAGAVGQTAADHLKQAQTKFANGDYAGAASDIGQASATSETIVICGMATTAKTAEEKTALEQQLELDAKNLWQWKPGKCRVDNCPSHPGQTEVGPCDVCHHCQALFDAGKNPANVYAEQIKRQTQRTKKHELEQKRHAERGETVSQHNNRAKLSREMRGLADRAVRFTWSHELISHIEDARDRDDKVIATGHLARQLWDSKFRF
jgi:hypothetical protein